MIFDRNLLFSEEQAITATADSTLKPDLTVARDIGKTSDLWLVFIVTETFDSAGEAATLQIGLTTDDNSSLSSDTVLQDMPAVIPEATLVQGYKLIRKLSPGAYERYLGLVYTVGTENFTAGKCTAFITDKPDDWKAYPGVA